MEFDVWLTRYNGGLFFSLASPGEEPRAHPQKTPSVRALFKSMRKNGYAIAQVGIIDPELIGLK